MVAEAPRPDAGTPGRPVRPGTPPSPSSVGGADGVFAADPSRSVRATITQAAIERAFAILLAVAALGFGAANLLPVLDQLPVLDRLWGPVAAGAVWATFLLVGASAFVRRLAQPAQAAAALVFLVVLVTWPLTVRQDLPADQVPWPWWLCNVATIAAAMGFATWRAAVYSVVVPVVYALVRVSEVGGGVPVVRAVLDGVYIMILGGAGLALIAVLRHAAATVDTAQATAMRRYSRAIREHATELERVQVDAIVHDSVLTTLLSAARADTPEARTLAAGMAANAINHLAAAAEDGPGEVPPVSVSVLRDRIGTAVTELAAPVVVRSGPLDERAVPSSVADAIASAALQAAVNSVQHAGSAAVGRWVVVTGTDEGSGVRVEVGDTGAGFDPATVPSERLGVRRSIVERVAAVGGRADVFSAPGRGTRIVLSWSPSAEGAGS